MKVAPKKRSRHLRALRRRRHAALAIKWALTPHKRGEVRLIQLAPMRGLRSQDHVFSCLGERRETLTAPILRSRSLGVTW